MTEHPTSLPPQPSSPNLERRVAVRHASLLDATCQAACSGPDSTCFARVWDLSTSGISLVIDHPLEPGTVLAMVLESAPGEFTRQLEARVLYASSHLQQLWLLGCEFTRPLADQELKELL